ncbi:phosphopantothenoylcysteine decarboxylase isoform X4 [Eptesicus fuscus]|uniref:phosphopantothenoylcysteine decarboxylase isoform X4 n=1 Tax=Eptesicus fuscus TaxID=29078 RepID=UPI002403AB8F|nr:phosphopantothenoylcysteine decarboxylase isoform X4 [Eptesicus fuscus]
MEPSSGRLPGLEATRSPMEPRATCPAAALLVERQFRVLVGVTGSVAALKLPLLVSKLLDIPGVEVAVVTTERAKHFYSPQDIPVTLYSDKDEWEVSAGGPQGCVPSCVYNRTGLYSWSRQTRLRSADVEVPVRPSSPH